MDKRIVLAILVLAAVVIGIVFFAGDTGREERGRKERLYRDQPSDEGFHSGSTPPPTDTFPYPPAVTYIPAPIATVDPTKEAMSHEAVALQIVEGMEKWPESWQIKQLPVTHLQRRCLRERSWSAGAG